MGTKGDGEMATVTHSDADVTYWAHDYWLGHCEGYRVYGPEGRVGIVEAVLGEEDEPVTLAVREGLFALRTLYVPIEDVIEVHPRAERIILRCSPGHGA
ncbi:MAG TPA: hypothetical protein VD695_07850 [Gaiellaceae bacterium]|nr:hypothetical protein [Gaiellaceae bacterium]